MKEIKKNEVGFKISVSKSSTQDGIDPNILSEPILIPLARLLREGYPPGILNPVIIEYDQVFYYFGTICLTKEKNIIFFPGFRSPIIVDEVKSIKGVLEHITADENYSKSHVKCRDRSKKLSNLRIIKTDSYYYWFTLAINSLENLDQDKEGLIKISVPNKDSERRKNELINAYKNGDVYFFNLNGLTIDKSNFLNFDFYFTDKKGNDFSDIKLFSKIAKPKKNNKIITKTLIFTSKEINKRLLIICSILEPIGEDIISDNNAKFFFLQKK